MIEIKDEILNGEARYRIRDKDGNIIFDNLTIEQITPVTQEGTPMGKKLFERIEDNNNLVKTYNVPSIVKRNDSYNYLALSNEILKYTIGMRVLIEIQQEYEDFNEPIIPILSGYGESYAVNGIYAYTSNSGSNHLAFDGDDNTYLERYPAGVVIPQGVKPTKIKLVYSSASSSKTDSLKVYPFITVTPVTSVRTIEEDVISNTYYTELATSSSYAYNRVHTLQITAGSIGKFCPVVNSYININNLGNKLINGLMEIGKRYELVYDGTMFSAREVV